MSDTDYKKIKVNKEDGAGNNFKVGVNDLGELIVILAGTYDSPANLVELYKKIETGERNSIATLGVLLFMGGISEPKGDKKQQHEGLALLREAAQKECAESQLFLSLIFTTAPMRSFKESSFWLVKSALNTNPHPQAQYLLAQIILSIKEFKYDKNFFIQQVAQNQGEKLYNSLNKTCNQLKLSLVNYKEYPSNLNSVEIITHLLSRSASRFVLSNYLLKSFMKANEQYNREEDRRLLMAEKTQRSNRSQTWATLISSGFKGESYRCYRELKKSGNFDVCFPSKHRTESAGEEWMCYRLKQLDNATRQGTPVFNKEKTEVRGVPVLFNSSLDRPIPQRMFYMPEYYYAAVIVKELRSVLGDFEHHDVSRICRDYEIPETSELKKQVGMALVCRAFYEEE